MKDLIYVLDDLLDMKYQCSRKEREVLMKEISREPLTKDNLDIVLVECVLIDETLIMINREKKKISKFISWDFHEDKGRVFRP